MRDHARHRTTIQKLSAPHRRHERSQWVELTLVYPHQLFAHHPALEKSRPVLLIEDPLFFGNDLHWPLRFHSQKLILHRASMSHWMTERIAEGFKVKRIDAAPSATTSDGLLTKVMPAKVKRLHVCDPTDDVLMRRLQRFTQREGIDLRIHPTPMFMSPMPWLEQQLASKKRPFMATFYQAQRKRLGILLDPDGGPTGGQWSFDADNRQRLPKGHRAPSLPVFSQTPELAEASRYVAAHFPQALGRADHFRWPVTRQQALQELEHFLHERLALFGHYEDAISSSQTFLYHSVLTAPLNIGLITPEEVVERTLAFAGEHKIPLNSLEGFIRQIIGWREFMHGIYRFHGVKVRKGNFWNHREALPDSFYSGTTGLPPVDAVIQRLEKHAWCHHIERLMVMGNIMVLLRLDPDAVYRWFMELFIDAYDWVMVPNVYGMSQFADGGTFTTKPYFSGSNYLLKMSDFPKGMWCAKWDELFWRFIGDHREFFLKNPRMSVLVRQWDKRQT
jgi:deoxyribodipyrimidine photolyase-related protein